MVGGPPLQIHAYHRELRRRRRISQDRTNFN